MPAHGQERFLKVCNNPDSYDWTWGNDIKWLKGFFKTSDCNEIVKGLSSLTSYNEFMIGEFVNSKDTKYSWEKDFPFIKGITGEYSHRFGAWWIDFSTDEYNIFQTPELYSEFENLSVIDLTQNMGFSKLNGNICGFFDKLPNIQTAIMSYGDLVFIDRNCKSMKLPWIIMTSANGANKVLFADKIIGIMSFGGSLGNLKKFKNLRYLGLSNSTEDNDIGYLAQNLNLTHLNLNMRVKGVKNITELRHLKNLEWLTLTCIDNITYTGFEDIPKTCDKPYLTDISFLSELPWLRYLDLTANKLSDVSVVKKLKRLESLTLNYNNISEMPDLSDLKELKNFDISNNPVSEK